jgi:hypothetical protein
LPDIPAFIIHARYINLEKVRTAKMLKTMAEENMQQ